MPDRSRGVLLSAAGPSMRRVLHEVAAPALRRYAVRWSLDVEVTDLTADGNGDDAAAVAARWVKLPLLRDALRRHPFAVWFDADVLVRRCDDDILAHLHPEAFQALALEQVPHEHRLNPNTGVWAMRAGTSAECFLDAVAAAGQQPGPWADQGAVLAVLGWDRGDDRYHWARPGRGSHFLDGTSWLPPSWNQPYLVRDDDDQLFNSCAASYLGRPSVAEPHAVHFMGMRPAARHAHMSAMAAGQRAPAPPGTAKRTAEVLSGISRIVRM